MSFINQEPYNFFTNTSTYHVSNFYPKTSEVYKNNFVESNLNPLLINTNNIESNISEKINNQNVVNASNNKTVNQNVIDRFNSNNSYTNTFESSKQIEKTSIQNDNISTAENTNQNIVQHNRQQIFSPNYTFFDKEMYYTIDPSNNESISEIKNMTFNEMKTRMVNKIQARTIVNNKENKVIVPAFADGGLVKGPNLIIAGEKNPEMIVPIKPKNSTQTIKGDSKTFLEGGNISQKIDSYPNDANASKAIEQNMSLKTTPTTKKELEIEELSDHNILKSPKKSNALNTSKLFFDGKSTDLVIARTKDLQEGMIDFTAKNKNTFVQDIKEKPIWRTTHM